MTDAAAAPTGQRASIPGLPAPGRCLVMGVVNVTPDSFSDGGLHSDHDAAIRHGLELVAEGADIVDVGGESTRPGAHRITPEEERRRVLPVIEGLVTAGVVVSVDTMRADIAEMCVRAGACMVNDVSGGLADPDMAGFVGAADVPFVVMHWRGHSQEMQAKSSYDDVVREVTDELGQRLDAVTHQGVNPSKIIVDPGLGFAKRAELNHNWALLAHLDVLAGLGHPLLIAGSRKRFLGRLLAGPDGSPRPFAECDAATVAVSAIAAMAGVWCVRVHQVRANADAVRVAEAWRGGRNGGLSGPPA